MTGMRRIGMARILRYSFSICRSIALRARSLRSL